MLQRFLSVVLVIFFLGGCGDTIDFAGKKPQQIADTIKKMDRHIQSFEVKKTSDDLYTIGIVYLAEPTPSPLLDESPQIKNILKSIATAKGMAAIGNVFLALQEPGIDALGNKANVLAVSLGWEKDFLHKAQWDTITYWQVINQAVVMEMGPFGEKAINKYCQDGADSYGKVFCKNIGYTMQ